MKATITKVEFIKERETKFVKLYDFAVFYDDRRAFYSSKSKDQNKFIPDQEVEFVEEEKTYTDKKSGELKSFWTVKPMTAGRQSNFGKALKKEQTKYSGFAVSYAKDLLVAGRIPEDRLKAVAWDLFNLMVEMDKSIEA